MNPILKDEASESLFVLSWNKAEKFDVKAAKTEVAEKLAALTENVWDEIEGTRKSKYISKDKASALFILAAKYVPNNKAYWYTIFTDDLPWLASFEKCYIAFILEDACKVICYEYKELEDLLNWCSETIADPAKNMRARYHIYFDVETPGKVYFKFRKKEPKRAPLDITDHLLRG